MSHCITVSELEQSIKTRQAPLIIDVRRAAAFEAAPAMLSDAVRGAPDTIEKWSKRLSKSREIVVYCVHGHEASQSVALHLNELGFVARYLEGGVETWKSAGLLLV